MAAEAGIGQTSMRRILKEVLRTYPYKMQKRHELSTTLERLRLDRCPESHERRNGAQFGVH